MFLTWYESLCDIDKIDQCEKNEIGFTVVSRWYHGGFTLVSRWFHGRFTVKTARFRLSKLINI